MTKEIWLPVAETKATVRNGKVATWIEMTMAPQPISTPIGFQVPRGDKA